LNYLALAAGILAGLIALRAVLIIATVSTGKKKYAYPEHGFIINAGFATVFGTLAVWLFGMVAA
jgi:hypothetical protein